MCSFAGVQKYFGLSALVESSLNQSTRSDPCCFQLAMTMQIRHDCCDVGLNNDDEGEGRSLQPCCIFNNDAESWCSTRVAALLLLKIVRLNLPGFESSFDPSV